MPTKMNKRDSIVRSAVMKTGTTREIAERVIAQWYTDFNLAPQQLSSLSTLIEAALNAERERAAWAELRRWEDNHDQLCLQREQLYCDIHVENAALREQLVQVEKELADWKGRVIAARNGRCPYHPWMFVEGEQP